VIRLDVDPIGRGADYQRDSEKRVADGARDNRKLRRAFLKDSRDTIERVKAEMIERDPPVPKLTAPPPTPVNHPDKEDAVAVTNVRKIPMERSLRTFKSCNSCGIKNHIRRKSCKKCGANRTTMGKGAYRQLANLRDF